MNRPNDGTKPITHGHIISISKPVTASAITDTFLSLLELFQEAEISWDFRHDLLEWIKDL